MAQIISLGGKKYTAELDWHISNAKDYKAEKDLQPTIDKMNQLINEYTAKSRPAYCAKTGMVDEIVPLYDLRGYISAFANAVYQNPKSICAFHQMILPRAIREFETYTKK